jgi:hypothetical protein
MREFEGGATRDDDDGKLDFEGFLSPLVLLRFAQYMDKHRHTAGGLRGSDNWQSGMSTEVYMKSLTRHFMDLWLIHRGEGNSAVESDIEEVLCAIMFNVQGYLFEALNGSHRADPEPVVSLRAVQESMEGRG